jgi:hypothetical protein
MGQSIFTGAGRKERRGKEARRIMCLLIELIIHTKVKYQ